MNTLYFVKFGRIIGDTTQQVVFLTTADIPELAERNAWEGIAVEYRAEYELIEVTAICRTPDTVTSFEPV